MIDNI